MSIVLMTVSSRSGTGCRSSHFHGGRLLEPQLHDTLLAHQELLYLAGHRHREGVHELHVARDLVMGDLPAAVVADLLGRRLLALAQADPGHDLLAVARVGNAD